ncbi:NADH-quinone oxidoreductase subunit J [Candidatus Zinderia endosymbiont of Aphrophora alni]|uniref:NADH-quinone oxidoreductase subunit J family protein n=1 Tax=Candidatus Zinderia endosymbiont of Aphrophora alni TaxID=3077951 RepID=UPI0030CB9D40
MNIKILYFLTSSILMLISALQVILNNNPINSALFLILTFFLMSNIWFFLKIEFLATILIVIYVGSIMILFLFIIMMMNLKKNKNKKINFKNFLLTIIPLIIILYKIIFFIYKNNFHKIKINNFIKINHNNIKKLGIIIYTKYIYAFEISSIILLVSIIAIVSIIINNKKKIKY